MCNLEAKIQYEELRRELSAFSQKTSPSKLELGQTDEFNLSEFLHGMSQELDANGKKRKHLGVLWENLHVEVYKKKKKSAVTNGSVDDYRDLVLMHLQSQRSTVASCMF